MLTYRKVLQTAKLPFCWIRGHRYDTYVFMTNCLYFCTRCGREMLGRTFDDIEPLSAEDRETLEYFDNIYGDGGH